MSELRFDWHNYGPKWAALVRSGPVRAWLEVYRGTDDNGWFWYSGGSDTGYDSFATAQEAMLAREEEYLAQLAERALR